MRQQYKQRSFYTDRQNNGDTILWSYDTIVGIIIDDTVYFTTTKYSITTSKQCSQFTNEHSYKRVNVKENDLQTLLKKSFNDCK